MRRAWIAAAVGLVAAIAIVIAIGLAWGDDGSPTQAGENTLSLSLGSPDAAASCLAFDPATLATMAPVFAGTARSVDGDVVVLDVDKWYTGDEVDTVELRAPSGFEALIGGITFVEGEPYLVSATDGIVNYCGYSGPATPELRSAFDSAFAP